MVKSPFRNKYSPWRKRRWNRPTHGGISVSACEPGCEWINCRRGFVRQIRRDSVENLLDRSLTGDLVTVLVGVGAPGWVDGGCWSREKDIKGRKGWNSLCLVFPESHQSPWHPPPRRRDAVLARVNPLLLSFATLKSILQWHSVLPFPARCSVM